MPVNELVKRIIADTHMREAYADDSDESINKRANIEEFVNSVEEYSRLNPEATLTDYLNQVTLSSDTDEMDDSNYVTLATVHSVKGLEFKCVFICGLEENILPVSRSMLFTAAFMCIPVKNLSRGWDMRETEMQSIDKRDIIPHPISTKAPKLSRCVTFAAITSPDARVEI